MPVIETENLKYVYGKNTPFENFALKGISFTLEQGETLGIIGCTGSGKSTLVQNLNGLIKPESGTVKFHGENIVSGKKTVKGLCFKIGLVFQYPEYQLFEDTVRKDIAYGPQNMNLTDEEVENRVNYAANAVGLSADILCKSPFEISGGEKRRVAIAGIMAMRPEVIVLDEPSAGLDPAGRKKVENAINEYKQTNNASVIIVSHSMEEVARLCDKVLILHKGEQVCFDTVSAAFSDTEMLKKCGLDLPQVAVICNTLRDKGLNIPKGIYLPEDAAGAIEKALKGGVNNV